MKNMNIHFRIFRARIGHFLDLLYFNCYISRVQYTPGKYAAYTPDLRLFTQYLRDLRTKCSALADQSKI